jgi:general secretion pathway protein G
MVFFERMLFYMELAERSAMEVTVMNVNSALAVRSAQAMLTGHAMPADADPFELVGFGPPNFLGALTSPDLASVQRGVWLFDADRKELLYLPRFRRGFTTSDPDQAIRYRAVVDGKTTKLVPTSKFVWQ